MIQFNDLEVAHPTLPPIYYIQRWSKDNNIIAQQSPGGLAPDWCNYTAETCRRTTRTANSHTHIGTRGRPDQVNGKKCVVTMTGSSHWGPDTVDGQTQNFRKQGRTHSEMARPVNKSAEKKILAWIECKKIVF